MRSVLRRATILVRDLDRSMAFYHGVFGLTPYAELNVDLERVPFFPVGPEPRSGASRFVILKGDDPLIGMIGLMEITDPPLPEPAHDVRRLGIGSTALVLSVSDADAAAVAAENLRGSILMPVTTARNLGNKDGGFVPAKLFMAQDPDGYFLEVFEETAQAD
jgi:predicted enzyme related to lactoylglutathione lyase|tara:strand:- start:2827 stop:3312 length:486 start_codon:yes stop_codon:yes gene_type:complete